MIVSTEYDTENFKLKEVAEEIFEFGMHYFLHNPEDLQFYAAEYFYRKQERPKTYLVKEYQTFDKEDIDIDESLTKSEDLLQTLKLCYLFRSLPDETLLKIAKQLKVMVVHQGDVIFEVGDPFDYVYIIQRGKFDVIMSSEENSDPECVYTYRNRGSFGEFAILHGQPRIATIEAKTDGLLWKLDSTCFRCYLYKAIKQKRNMFGKFFEKVSVLNKLKPYSKMKLADALVTKFFEKGTCIIEEFDDNVDGMYFVLSGTVICTMYSASRKKNIKVATIKEGGYFGELALVTGGCRAANVIAETDVTLAFLDNYAFEDIMGPCVYTFNKNVNLYEKIRNAAFALSK